MLPTLLAESQFRHTNGKKCPGKLSFNQGWLHTHKNIRIPCVGVCSRWRGFLCEQRQHVSTPDHGAILKICYYLYHINFYEHFYYYTKNFWEKKLVVMMSWIKTICGLEPNYNNNTHEGWSWHQCASTPKKYDGREPFRIWTEGGLDCVAEISCAVLPRGDGGTWHPERQCVPLILDVAPLITLFFTPE